MPATAKQLTREIVGAHPTRTAKTFSGKRAEAHPLSLQRGIGNHALRELLQCKTKAGAASPVKDKADSHPSTSGKEVSPRPNESERSGGLPNRLRTALEALSGIDLSGIRVHRNSRQPAELNALAYTQGQDIHLGPGQDKHLAHEGWHVVQQRQGRVKSAGLRVNDVAINDDTSLESEADRAAARALRQPLTARRDRPKSIAPVSSQSAQPVQRQVRIGGGGTKIKEAEYQGKGAKKSVGSKFSVGSLISDGVKRVFSDVTELEDYANGKTDYIGDVAPSGAPKAWYRLPKNKMTVLGEFHNDPKGNAEDVILGLGTSRFMYEAFNELTGLPVLPAPATSTQARLAQMQKGETLAGKVDRAKFNPDLENIVIKAVAGAAITRNEFIAGNPATFGPVDIAQWGSRPNAGSYSYGERAALYLSFGIHLAIDVAKNTFGAPSLVESPLIKSARSLKEFYFKNQTVLDQFKTKKDGDDLIGIYELTKPNNFKILPMLTDFTLVLHEYGSRYIAQLGSQTGNKALEAEGTALASKPGAKIDDLSPAREEIMWEKIKNAKGYLVVGMGDAHRGNLQTKLAAASIPNEEVQASITRQNTEVNMRWKP
jgi:hypothetical protein